MLQNFLNFKNKKTIKSIIEKIIDEEVLKSEYYGLNIEKRHIKEEKDIIIPTFDYYHKIIKDLDSNKYSHYRNNISNFIFKKLEINLKYYFDKSINDVRNKYNCHLTSVIDRLFIEINSGKW